MKIYNTLKRKKQEFDPTGKKKIGIYVCGPTVYDEPHIGHARSAYIFDVIVKYLRFKFKDKKVIFVRNVTDIDDKIIDRARKEPGEEKLKEKVKKISKKYLLRYHEDIELLGLIKPDKEPKATETIKDIILFTQSLIDKGYAYEANGDVYFSVRKFKEYGSLSGQSIDEMSENKRVQASENKKDPLDFVLWKSSKAFEPYWKSPWGMGRPGWHIECSVMSTKFLKSNFMIHGGGLDLIFPHHENEIAQTVCADKKSADYWVHNGLLTIDGQKMSKSLGNFISIKDILTKYHSEVLKILFLSGHYRSPVDFTNDKMEEARRGRERFYILFDKIERFEGSSKDSKIKDIDDLKIGFRNAMDDDFNTPLALGYLYDIVSVTNRLIDEKKGGKKSLAYSKKALLELGSIFGLFKDDFEFKKRHTLEGRIKDEIKKRKDARIKGDYKLADKIRTDLLNEGIILEDTKEGTIWRRKV